MEIGWLEVLFAALCMTSRRFLTREFNGRVANKVNRFSLPMRFDPIQNFLAFDERLRNSRLRSRGKP